MSTSRRTASRRQSMLSFALEPVERRLMLASISGQQWNDYNADGVKQASEPALPGWTVYLDDNDNGSIDQSAPTTLSATDVPKNITDNTTVNSTLVIASLPGNVADINLTLDITHTYCADLDISLVSPTGTIIDLSSDNGGSNNNYTNTTFDDQAATSITTGVAPFTGTYRPEAPLALVNGQLANGTWTLRIADDATTDIGTLNSWSMTVRTGEGSLTTDSNGNYTFSGLAAGTYHVRNVLQATFNPTLPAGGVYHLTLGTSDVSTGNNFGQRQNPGKIRGVIWNDYNNNGSRQAGEPGLPGWTVYADTNNNLGLDAGERTTLTDGTGAYDFGDLPPGNYTIRQVIQPGFLQSYPGTGGVVLRPGSGDTGTQQQTQADRTVSQSEVVASVNDRHGLRAFDRYLRDNPGSPLAGMINLTSSNTRQLFVNDGDALVQLDLAGGHDAEKVVEAIAELPFVVWSAPNYVYGRDPRDLVPNDPQVGSQYHHTSMNNYGAWDTTLGISSIVIGVTDDGVDYLHNDLAPNIWNNSDEIAGNLIDDDGNGYVDDTLGWDFWNNDNTPQHESGNSHGTHVAGIAAARTNNALQVAGTAGNATIMPLRFYGSSGNSWTSTMIAATYAYGANNGAKIITTSYNVDSFAADPIFIAGLNYMYSQGVLHFNSAGNNSQLNPARQVHDHSLFVASTDNGDGKSSFSNYGWGIDIAAPGGSILSTLPGNTTGNNSGTSMATPNAAGAAALIWSAHPTWTREQVAAALIGNADDIDGVGTPNPTLEGLLGGGRVNSFKSVTQAVAPPKFKANGLLGLPAEGGSVVVSPTSFTLDTARVLDPALANSSSSWELRGNGLDDVFGTADDVLIPLTRNFTYRVGTNRMSFGIGATLTPDTYRFTAFSGASGLKDPFGTELDGNGDGTAGDAFTRTFNITPTSYPFIVTLDPGEIIDVADFGSHDVTPPTISSSLFDVDTSPNPMEVSIDFSDNVQASLILDSTLRVKNVDTNTYVPAGNMSLTYGAGDVATIRFPGYALGALPAGNYQLIATTGVMDISGNALASQHTLDFFFINGDVTRNKSVNSGDFNVLATNFGATSGMVFTDGDCTFDGAVNSADFNVLATAFGTSIPGMGEAGRSTGTGAPGGAGSSGSTFNSGSTIRNDDDDSGLGDLLA